MLELVIQCPEVALFMVSLDHFTMHSTVAMISNRQAKCLLEGWFIHGFVHRLSFQPSLFFVLSYRFKYAHKTIFSAFNLLICGNLNFWNNSFEGALTWEFLKSPTTTLWNTTSWVPRFITCNTNSLIYSLQYRKFLNLQTVMFIIYLLFFSCTVNFQYFRDWLASLWR